MLLISGLAQGIYSIPIFQYLGRISSFLFRKQPNKRVAINFTLAATTAQLLYQSLGSQQLPERKSTRKAKVIERYWQDLPKFQQLWLIDEYCLVLLFQYTGLIGLFISPKNKPIGETYSHRLLKFTLLGYHLFGSQQLPLRKSPRKAQVVELLCRR